MTVFIDADACPVVDITAELAFERNIPCVLICDTAHTIERDGCTTVTADKGADSADIKLFNMIKSGDICVTQDYGLAAMCLGKGAAALNQNGLIYTDKNIETLLYTRYVNKKIRLSGGRTKGPKPRTAENDEAFRRSLIKILNEKSSDRKENE